MPTIINADTASGGAIITGDSSGQLQLQSGGVTALTTNGANVTVAGTFTATGGVSGVSLTTGVTGTLPVANGGTGAVTLTGVVKGNGTSAFTASTVSLTTEVSDTLPVANGGTGAVTLTGVVKGNGTSAFTASTVSLTTEVSGTLPVANGGTGVTTSTGTGSVVLSASPTFTGTAAFAVGTFSGSSSQISSTFPNIKETTTVSAIAATGTINYDVTTQSVLYYTTNASANFTVNLRASSGTTLNNAMSTGEAITVAFLVTNGGTAYYNTAVQVDGSSVTPKWQGGVAPTTGNTSSIDIYSYTVIKTANATFTVLASQTQFA